MAERFFSQSLLAMASFRRDAKSFLEGGAKVLKSISSIVEETESFELSGESLKRASNMGLTGEAAFSALKVAEFVYDHSRHMKLSPEAITAEFEQLAPVLGTTVDKAMLDALTELLKPKARYDQQQAIRLAVSRGPASLQKFSLAVDVRAVTEGESGRMLGFVPIILGGISVEDYVREESYFAFSLSTDDLKDIRDTVDKALSEVESITTEFKGKLLS